MIDTGQLPAIFLDKRYSTTRMVSCRQPSDTANSSDGADQTRRGGLKTKGYFKKTSIEKPLITVITAVYNGSDYLEGSIESVLKQSYDNLEYLIVDGGSTDGTIDILREHDHAIDYWVSEPDKGIYHAMNKALAFAAGDWILFLGSDDSLVNATIISEYIQCLSLRLRDDPDFNPVMIFGNVIYSNGHCFRSALNYRILLHNTVHHQSVLYHRQLFNSFRYDAKLSALADYELNLSIYLNRYPTLYVDKSLSFCRFGGLSSNVRHRAHLIREINSIRKKYVSFSTHILMTSLLYIRAFGRFILLWI